MSGKEHTDQAKQMMSVRKKNLKPTEFCDRCKGYFTKSIYVQHHGELCGVKKSNLVLKESLKLVPKVTCVHCGISTNPGNHNKWHGDKCRSKSTEKLI